MKTLYEQLKENSGEGTFMGYPIKLLSTYPYTDTIKVSFLDREFYLQKKDSQHNVDKLRDAREEHLNKTQPKPRKPKNKPEPKIYFNEKKKATTLIYGNKVTVVKCAEDTPFSKRIGFLEAYFQATVGGTKTQAEKKLQAYINDAEVICVDNVKNSPKKEEKKVRKVLLENTDHTN